MKKFVSSNRQLKTAINHSMNNLYKQLRELDINLAIQNIIEVYNLDLSKPYIIVESRIEFNCYNDITRTTITAYSSDERKSYYADTEQITTMTAPYFFIREIRKGINVGNLSIAGTFLSFNTQTLTKRFDTSLEVTVIPTLLYNHHLYDDTHQLLNTLNDKIKEAVKGLKELKDGN